MDYQKTPKTKYECLLFDIDDTIYPFSSGLAVEIRKNIEDYMSKKLGMDESKILELCYSLYQSYGTTMAGLRAIGYEFDYDDFHSYVHGRLPYNELLKPDPILKNLLHSLPIRKVIFTNGDKQHAARVLARLGLEDCFDSIICFETLNPTKNCNDTESGGHTPNTTSHADINSVNGNSTLFNAPKTPVLCKPSEEAYEQAFKIANINPQKTLFFDDSTRNIQSGKRVGLHTVLVGSSHRIEGADYALETLHNIREAFPELWEVGEEKTEMATPSGKVTVEYVRA